MSVLQATQGKDVFECSADLLVPKSKPIAPVLIVGRQRIMIHREQVSGVGGGSQWLPAIWQLSARA
ncbi:hypothetical protein E4191_22980 (plasmid) [Paracoccus liaowanqingii]|uniref:Uncharacterized protein n=1 Tax=Paracoccus liaowanqingii TaxID=2560053 RepID=A0A4Y5SVX6_9RHOB|nr:hypothetical protein [Paracoccus liaowanqingii]QDA36914.1 hypothetical protein E4191_22980 [Paracoccus liaowanqingii]